ncbi:MAG: queuosine precursor transporter [Legionellales bacterium]|nr:queuosine precursor transporter [Legionellales bacterium]
MQDSVIDALSRRKQYKYPYFFLALYLTLLLSTTCLASKLTLIGTMLVPGGIFVFPLTFSICDIVGEVYGYAYPRLFIWVGILAEFVFSIIVITVSHLPVPAFFEHADAYQIVFDPTLRYVGAGLLGLLVGEFANTYLLVKWKIFLRGRFFIFRSLLSTAFGQACLTVIVDIFNYFGKLSDQGLGWMMVYGYCWKMLCALIVVFPAWLLVRYLKKVENVDHYDVNTNFNPFILSLNEGEEAAAVARSVNTESLPQ